MSLLCIRALGYAEPATLIIVALCKNLNCILSAKLGLLSIGQTDILTILSEIADESVQPTCYELPRTHQSG